MGNANNPTSVDTGSEVIDNYYTTATVTGNTLTTYRTISGLTTGATTIYRITVWGTMTNNSPHGYIRLQTNDGTNTTTCSTARVTDNNGNLSWQCQFTIGAQSSGVLTKVYCHIHTGGEAFDTANFRIHGGYSEIVTLGGGASWTAITSIIVQACCSTANPSTIRIDRVLCEKLE